MKDLEKHWEKCCLESPQSLAFPEGQDVRIQEASYRMIDSGEVREVFYWGKPNRKDSRVIHIDSNDSEIVNMTEDFLLRCWGGKKGEVWCKEFARDPLYQAGCFLSEQKVQAVVAGIQSTTSSVIRAALKAPGLKNGIQTLSSAFLMQSPMKKNMLFADCGVVVEPKESELVDIAVNAVELHYELSLGVPKVAFLSFSTHASSEHKSLQRIRSAVEMFKKRHPEIAVDGEIQVDAALVPSVASHKSPESPIGGDANILIFPDLNSGNIAYKLMERLAGYKAWGPILLGLKKPYTDLSRGASVEDVVASSRLALTRSLSL
ncbi:MAG: phosphate acyltransferase [Oligoflexales bacterium]